MARIGRSLVVALLLAGSQAAAAASLQRSHTTLGGCIARWNHAALGDGRRLAAAVAAAEPASNTGRQHALMFVSADGVCGFSFPRRIAEGESDNGIYVTALGGDYALDGPLIGPASHVDMFSLWDRATHRVNVRVNSRSGRVTPLPGARLAASSARVIDSSSPCAVVTVTFNTDYWKVIQRTTSCVWVRVLAWNWDQDTRAVKRDRSLSRKISAWRCVGDAGPVRPGRSHAVVCRKGSGLVRLTTR